MKSISNSEKILLAEGVIIAGVFAAGMITKKAFDSIAERRDDNIFSKMAKKSDEVKIINACEKRNFQKVELFLKRTEKKEIIIKSFDGIILYAQAFERKRKTDKWAVIVHGYSGSSSQMYLCALRFYSMGYNVLIPDCRGHGNSAGKYVGLGWQDGKDLAAWTKEIVARNKNAEIVLYGVSMGGTSVLTASGENLPSNTKAIIADCAYTSVADQFCWYLKSRLKFPSFPFLSIAEIICIKKLGHSMIDASALEQVKKSRTPILFIHGKNDKCVPVFMTKSLYNAANCPKCLFIMDAGHGACSSVDEKKYWTRVRKFINKYS